MGREDGAALVEFALVVVLLLTMTVGVLTYGVVLWLQQSLTHTASAAARSAIVVPESEIPARVAGIADEQLAWMGAAAGHVQVQPTLVGPCPEGLGTRCVTVDIRYPWGDRPLIPSFLGLPTPDVVGATATLELEGTS